MFKGWSKSIKGNLFVIFGLIVLVLLVTNIAFVRFVNRIDIMYSEATDTIVLLSDMSESVSDAESELRDVINEGTINRFNVLVNNLTDIEIKLTDARAGIKDEETYYYMVFLGNMLNSFLDELHYFEDDLLYADRFQQHKHNG